MAFIELVTFQVRFSVTSLVMELITLSTIIKYEIKMKWPTVNVEFRLRIPDALFV